MLNEVYEKKKEKMEVEANVSDLKALLIKKLRSKARYNQLIETLPEDFEDRYKIHFYTNYEDVLYNFSAVTINKYGKNSTIKERLIDAIIVNPKYFATPGKFEEYLKKSSECQNKWVSDSYNEERELPKFHVDHNLCWISKERKIDVNSNDNIENIPFEYSIHVYTPSNEILVEVENIKLQTN